MSDTCWTGCPPWSHSHTTSYEPIGQELRALRESHAALKEAAEAVDEWFGHIHDDVPMDEDRYGQLMCEHGAESAWKRAVFANLSAALEKAEAING